MKMKKVLASLVATSLVGTSVVAQAAAPAARTGTPVADAENIRGGWFLPALAIIAIILGIIVLLDNGEDLPTSP